MEAGKACAGIGLKELKFSCWWQDLGVRTADWCLAFDHRLLLQVPALKQYAQRPTVTYLVYAVLAAPIVTIMVPLIALGGETLLPTLPSLPNPICSFGHWQLSKSRSCVSEKTARGLPLIQLPTDNTVFDLAPLESQTAAPRLLCTLDPLCHEAYQVGLSSKSGPRLIMVPD